MIKRKVLSNVNFCDMKFVSVDFDGEWLASFGKPELRGSWIIWGGSSSGKTTFALMLAKYLTNFGQVLYNSLEQGLSKSLQSAWERVNMHEVGRKILLMNKTPIEECIEYLKKRRSPDIIFIDSIDYTGINKSAYIKLKELFPGKLFIWISHESKGMPKTSVAQYVRFDADIKIRTHGFLAHITSRFENRELGEGGEDFVVWKEGAEKFILKNKQHAIDN